MITGKTVLEIGCASGCDAVRYSYRAAHYVGIDLSNEAIENCSNLNLANAKFICADCHNIPLPNDSIDCVIVNSLLHHLDFDRILVEIDRVLEPLGRLFFREPLGINVVFRLYRWFTPGARTPDECPLSRANIEMIFQIFDIEELHWFGFTSIFSAFVKNLWFRRTLTKLDYMLSYTMLRYQFWQISGVAVSRKSSCHLISE